MTPGTCNFFVSLKKEIIKKEGPEVEPRPLALQAGMTTATLPTSCLLDLEIVKLKLLFLVQG